MAIQEITYNDNINPMDFAYLRTKINAPFIKVQVAFPIQQEGNDTDDLCNCCDADRNFIQLALSNVDDSDPLQNDYLSLLYEVPLTSSTITLTLQKFTTGGWINKATLNSTYGTVYNVGIFSDNPLFGGYKLAWRTILAAFEEGLYRVKTVASGLTSNTTTYSVIYCLKPYSIYSADRTIRFEWNNNGFISQSDDDFVLTDFGNINWQEMIRLTGNFRYDKDEQTIIENSFYSGNSLEIERVRDLTNPRYKFQSGFYPDWIHSKLKNYAFKSNSLIVTNYNRLSKHNYERKAIVKESNGYNPKMDNTYKKWYNVEVDFKDKYDDAGFRKNCQPSGNNCEPVNIVDESGNVIDTIPAGGVYVDSTASGSNVIVSNSDDSYTETVMCGDTLELPDTTIKIYLDGILQDTQSFPTLEPTTTVNINWN